MTTAVELHPLRVGALRPNQLLHTYGVGAMADLPNLSVVMLGLDFWNLERSRTVPDERLLAAVRAKLGQQVDALRLPPYLPETFDPFAEWTRVGVPVGLFPSWLRCSRCHRLGRADGGFFELLRHAVQPDLIRYVHPCSGRGGTQPVAVPARFVLACDDGHLDDFPWLYYAHRDAEPESGHSLKMTESGSTGEAASVFVSCDECGKRRPMSDAFGEASELSLPACRGRHPHLGTFQPCDRPTRTLVLGATNGWFPLQLRAFTLPRDRNPLDHLVAEFWRQLEPLAGLPEPTAKQLMPTQTCWPELEPYGADRVWHAIRSRVDSGGLDQQRPGELDLLAPEWEALTSGTSVNLPEFTTHHEPVPSAPTPGSRKWCWCHACARSWRFTASPASTLPNGKCRTPRTVDAPRCRAPSRLGCPVPRCGGRACSCGSTRPGSPSGSAAPRPASGR